MKRNVEFIVTIVLFLNNLKNIVHNFPSTHSQKNKSIVHTYFIANNKPQQLLHWFGLSCVACCLGKWSALYTFNTLSIVFATSFLIGYTVLRVYELKYNSCQCIIKPIFHSQNGCYEARLISFNFQTFIYYLFIKSY